MKEEGVAMLCLAERGVVSSPMRASKGMSDYQGDVYCHITSFTVYHKFRVFDIETYSCPYTLRRLHYTATALNRQEQAGQRLSVDLRSDQVGTPRFPLRLLSILTLTPDSILSTDQPI